MSNPEPPDGDPPPNPFSLASLGRTKSGKPSIFKSSTKIGHKSGNKEETDQTDPSNEDRKPAALPPDLLRKKRLSTLRSPYTPLTQEEIHRHSSPGPKTTAHLGKQDYNPSLDFVPASTMLSNTSTTSPLTSTLFDPFLTNHTDESYIKKPIDFSMRSKMITERIRFEIMLDSIEGVDVRTKALVLFGKLINADPTRKILPYYDEDEEQFSLLEKPHDLPTDLDKMTKYIVAPMLNTKAKKLQFHTRFRSVTSILEMKREQDFMTWLKHQKIYTTVMTLATTENTRAGFFLGKGPHITNLESFSKWVHSRLKRKSNNCPEFQLNVEGIGRHRDPSTKSRAIVVICSNKDVTLLRDLLDTTFNSRSNLPFIPFPVMYSLDTRTQNSLYKAHKTRSFGAEMLEIGIPEFYELDTKISHGNSHTSLRDACFELTDSSGKNLFVDIDNDPRSGITVFQVRKEDKQQVLENINLWILKNFQTQIQWNSDHQFEAKTYRLESKYRSLANQFSELAVASLPKSNPNIQLIKTSPAASKQANSPSPKAWVDLTKVREIPRNFSEKASATEEEATVTTLTDSTWHSLTNANRTETNEKFKLVGRNVRHLSYRHKKVEVGQECLETSIALKFNQLFRCFEVHHNRLERLEAARDRHLAIQLQHLHYTLDPVAAEQDGTLDSLKKLLRQESKVSVKDKHALAQDINALEGDHEEDKEFLVKQEKAGWLFDYYHDKLADSDEESEFDVRNLSDVSDDDSSISKTSESSLRESNLEPSSGDLDTKEDVTMLEVITDQLPVDLTARTSLSSRTMNSNPENSKSPDTPESWETSEVEEEHPSLIDPLVTNTQQTWTTPSRPLRKAKLKSPGQSTSASSPTKPTLHSKTKARNLIRQAFSSSTANRFSILNEETPIQPAVGPGANKVISPSNNTTPEPDSDYEEVSSSEDTSLEDMSLVSSSEMQGLEDDLRDFDDDGYDTETTDNTSPSKTHKAKKRKSSAQARTRISALYSPNALPPVNLWTGAEPDISSPGTLPGLTNIHLSAIPLASDHNHSSIPHPPLNTNSQSGDPGAETT
jgi:hypothetical protein